MANSEEYIEKQQAIADKAEAYPDQEIANGVPFSEGLCNWATHKAEQETS